MPEHTSLELGAGIQGSIAQYSYKAGLLSGVMTLLGAEQAGSARICWESKALGWGSEKQLRAATSATSPAKAAPGWSVQLLLPFQT